MLKFYRKKHCPNCSNIEKLLEELDHNYQIVLIEENENSTDKLPEDTIFPALVDEDKILQGSNAIIKRIEELETFKNSKESQGDADYPNN